MKNPKDGPATYQVRVQGALDPQWSDFLGDMSIVTEYPDGQKPVTILTGRLPDQSALAGVLDGLHDLGFALLSVELLAEG
jgi:hypothetical protein